MKELNDEIKLTINTMQCDIDDGAHGELQSHLHSLLEIKRDELQQRLVDRSWLEPVAHDEAKPLTTEELKAGGWWCADVSDTARHAFESRGFNVEDKWELEDDVLDGCKRVGKISVGRFRGMLKTEGLREITIVDGDFYWSEK